MLKKHFQVHPILFFYLNIALQKKDSYNQLYICI